MKTSEKRKRCEMQMKTSEKKKWHHMKRIPQRETGEGNKTQ